MVSPYVSPVLSFLLVLSYVLSLVTDESSVRHHVSICLRGLVGGIGMCCFLVFVQLTCGYKRLGRYPGGARFPTKREHGEHDSS